MQFLERKDYTFFDLDLGMLETKTVGKPCAGKPHARFDEGVW